MFNGQHWKIKLVYIGFGSLFGCLCTIIGMLASPATAQRDKFQEIECTKLTLIDPVAGIKTAELATGKHGGLLYLFGSNENRGAAKLYADKEGGELVIFSNERAGENHISASIRTTKDGAGAVKINHRNGGQVFMSATDDGGFVSIYGAKHKKLLASIGITDDGESGLISASRYDYGKRTGRAELTANQNGGVLAIYGKTDDKSRVVVGISEHGHSAVSTWDKNGYRQ